MMDCILMGLGGCLCKTIMRILLESIAGVALSAHKRLVDGQQHSRGSLRAEGLKMGPFFFLDVLSISIRKLL